MIKKFFAALGAKIKEFFRKLVVSLKRNPSVIPLLMLLVAFLVYSLNLTALSNTTAKIQGKGMGLAEFAIMLLSLLSMVCMLNAFPRRKKPNYPMVALMFVMFGIMIYCDFHYRNAIFTALYRPENPIQPMDYMYTAYSVLWTHIILIGITAALVLLLPVYTKLLKKINTTVEIEDNGSMGEIEIAE